jgi:hypothetical protein
MDIEKGSVLVGMWEIFNGSGIEILSLVEGKFLRNIF